MKTQRELIISLENIKVDRCFEAKKTYDNDGPPYKYSPYRLEVCMIL